MVNLNPGPRPKTRKRYIRTIANCSECPVWRDCPNDSHLRGDLEFPHNCLLKDHTPTDEISVKWVGQGGGR